MSMRAQPHGMHRTRRGVPKYNSEGRPLPADEYDIKVKGGAVIGYTKRAAKGKGWYALTLEGKSLGTTEEGLPRAFATHAEAMSMLGAEYAAKLLPDGTEDVLPEPVRSEAPEVTEEESIEVILVDLETPEEEYPQESDVTDPVGTMPGDEEKQPEIQSPTAPGAEVPIAPFASGSSEQDEEGMELPPVLEELSGKIVPPKAPPQAQERSMADTDDWLAPPDAEQVPDFADPFAGPAS